MSEIRRIHTGRVTADFFTSSYRFSASIIVYKRRLIDVLSDRITDYLDLVDIYVSRINNPGSIVATYHKGSLVKNEITLYPPSKFTASFSGVFKNWILRKFYRLRPKTFYPS